LFNGMSAGQLLLCLSGCRLESSQPPDECRKKSAKSGRNPYIHGCSMEILLFISNAVPSWSRILSK